MASGTPDIFVFDFFCSSGRRCGRLGASFQSGCIRRCIMANRRRCFLHGLVFSVRLGCRFGLLRRHGFGVSLDLVCRHVRRLIA